MTTHLDEVELVDALDGLLSAARDTHLEQCSSCAERLRSLRASLAGLRQSADVPEPSPFFWEHFSRRVSDAVRAGASASQAAGRWRPARIAALSAAALVVIAASTTMILRMPPRSDGPQPATAVVRRRFRFDRRTALAWVLLAVLLVLFARNRRRPQNKRNRAHWTLKAILTGRWSAQWRTIWTGKMRRKRESTRGRARPIVLRSKCRPPSVGSWRVCSKTN